MANEQTGSQKPPSYVKTLLQFFGKKDGQDLAGFGAELRELSDEEKKQLGRGVEDGTLTY